MSEPPVTNRRPRTARLLLLAVATTLAFALASCAKREEAPSAAAGAGPAGGRDTRPEVVMRGRYLAAAGGCYACHTVRGGQPYAGGIGMATPFGVIYGPNITPDKETGIGTWTADDFWGAMHEGKSKDGSFLYPAMPFTNYTKVRRADSDALYAYFMSLEPVRCANSAHTLGFPFNQRQGVMLGWRALYFKPGVFKENAAKSKAWNRGAYLVEGLGHCNACHAARNLLGAVSGDEGYSGGLIPVQNWFAPSLTSGSESSLSVWEPGDIVELLRTGVSRHSAVFGPMAAVVQHSLQQLTPADLSAMATYLKEQAEHPTTQPWLGKKGSEAGLAAQMATGAKVYKDHCAACHGENGEGVPRIYPPLANNHAITMRNPVNLIRMVLNGGFPPSTEGNPRPYGMPPFYPVLSDEQIAAVVTYIRQSWGNRAAPTWTVEVSRSRGMPVD